MNKLAPIDTWPELRVTFLPLPWTWAIKPKLYADDVEGALSLCYINWLFLRIEWWGQKGGWRNQFIESPSS